jgi:hypothetical protein
MTIDGTRSERRRLRQDESLSSRNSFQKYAHLYGMEDRDPDILQDAARQFGTLTVPEKADGESIMRRIAEEADRLIREDFARLVAILYRIDINEAALKRRIRENASEPAGRIIAEMIVERLLEKKKSREASKKPTDGIPEDERW